MTTLGEYANVSSLPMPDGRRPRQRRFNAATDVQVLFREDATATGALGIGIGVYSPVKRADAATCGHQTTICAGCRREWEQDHHIGVFEHGTPNGHKNCGCRCGPCSGAAAARATPPRRPERAG